MVHNYDQPDDGRRRGGPPTTMTKTGSRRRSIPPAVALGYSVIILLQSALVSCLPQIDIAITVIEEVLVPDSIVRNLTDDPRIRTRYSRDALAIIRYQYLSAKPAAFSVDASGTLRTTGWVDREAICPYTVVCRVEFDLAIQPIRYFALVKVAILIQDINDHGPVFVRSDVTHVVSESTRAGMTFVLPKVSDPDSPRFSVQRVYLKPATDQFGLRTSPEPRGVHAVRLILKSVLDRETVPEYRLQVVAVDGGSPAKSGTLNVHIIVADANDNHPSFDRDIYEVTVPENVPTGYTLLSVHATDMDTGLNSRIVYRWSADTAASLGDVFRIDNDTGEVMVKGLVDYEMASVLYLTAEAQDCGADPIPAEALIVVHIEDVNDHAPEILIHTLAGPGNREVSVSESSAPGTFVARIVVGDRDSGQNARYNCSLDGGEHFVLDPLDSDFLITTRGSLDREQRASYSLAISCRDFGIKPLTSVTYIQVDISDVNDNGPRFSSDAYFTRIAENSYPRTVLIQMNATDPDSGPNGQIEYLIEGDVEKRWFSIDSISGIVRTRASLDRELKASHTLSIIARDGGDPPNSALATLTVDVLDTNDEAPTFSQRVYVFRVYENADPETTVGFVQATDADSPPYSRHTYSIRTDAKLKEDGGSAFRIGSRTGRIRTARRLDRERRASYVLTVIATDSSSPHFSTSATVSVHVMDRNDNPPRFVFPTPRNNTALIGNRLPVGYVVTKVKAEDDDSDTNGQVRYELVVTTDDGQYFDVDPYTGVVTLTSSLADIDNDTFALTIIASDGGDVTMSTSATLFIVVDSRYAVPLSNIGINKLSNFITIIIVACISAMLVVILVVGILLICHRRRRLDECDRNRKCQMEPLETFVDGGVGSPASVSAEKMKMKKMSGRCIDGKYSPPPSPGCRPQRICHGNHLTSSPEVDLTIDKSKPWIECDRDDKDVRSVSRRTSITSNLDRPIHPNTDTANDQPGSDKTGLQTNMEYGMLRGFYKDPLITPSHVETDLPRMAYNGNFRTFTGKGSTGSLVVGLRSAKPRSPFAGCQRTSTGSRPAAAAAAERSPEPVSVYELNQDVRARCYDSLARPYERQLGPKPSPFISAHGYSDDVTSQPTNSRRYVGQAIPSPSSSSLSSSTSSKRLRFNLDNVGDFSRSKTFDHYELREEYDPGTVTHTENGVKVTDIVT